MKMYQRKMKSKLKAIVAKRRENVKAEISIAEREEEESGEEEKAMA